MTKIKLKKIDDDNVIDVIKLSKTLTEEQKKCVAPNEISLAQAYANRHRTWPRAIYAGKKLVGFVMVALWDEGVPEEDRPAYFLWRMMMAKEEQHKGYGRQTLDLIVEKCKKDGKKTLYASCHHEGKEPYSFYMNYGFIDTGKEMDDEAIIKFVI